MSDLDDVFTKLRELLARHEASLVVVRDEPGDVQMETQKAGPSGTPMWFGAVQTGAEHVSFHLMPVASHPDVIAEISDPLRERLQGRSCFAFTADSATPDLLEELGALVDAGLARYRVDKLA